MTPAWLQQLFCDACDPEQRKSHDVKLPFFFTVLEHEQHLAPVWSQMPDWAKQMLADSDFVRMFSAKQRFSPAIQSWVTLHALQRDYTHDIQQESSSSLRRTKYRL